MEYLKKKGIFAIDDLPEKRSNKGRGKKMKKTGTIKQTKHINMAHGHGWFSTKTFAEFIGAYLLNVTFWCWRFRRRCQTGPSNLNLLTFHGEAQIYQI